MNLEYLLFPPLKFEFKLGLTFALKLGTQIRFGLILRCIHIRYVYMYDYDNIKTTKLSKIRILYILKFQIFCVPFHHFYLVKSLFNTS